MSEKSRCRESLNKEHGKRAETLWKSERQHLYRIYWSLWQLFTFKKSLWLICKILGLFVNPLTADGKYSLLNWGNLLQRFQTQLSQKRKTFLEFFYAFPKSRFNFEHFEKKDDLQSWCIFELRDVKNRG